MAFRILPQPSGHLVVVVFEGEISREEERQALLEFAAQPGVDLASDVLVDRTRSVTTAESADVGPQIELARTVFPQRDSRPRLAIVAPHDYDFGMARMLELSGGDRLPHRVMVVRTLEEACTYLEVALAEIVWE